MSSKEKLYTCIAQYIAFASSEVQANTLANYRRHLEAFAAWCEANGAEPESTQTIAAYKGYLRQNGDKPSTIMAKLRTLSIFFAWASDETIKLYEANPVTHRVMPKEKLNPYDKAEMLSDLEIKFILGSEAKLKQHGPKILRPRNHALVILMLTTGLRTSEAIALTEADLDWEKNQIAVEHGKGDKRRYVMFPYKAQVEVRAYLASGYRPRSSGKTAPLFGDYEPITNKWRPLTRQGVYKIVRKYVSDVIGKDLIGGHDLRHANAELLLNHGASLEAIQTLFGHANISTTQRYAKRLRSDLACEAGASVINAL